MRPADRLRLFQFLNGSERTVHRAMDSLEAGPRRRSPLPGFPGHSPLVGFSPGAGERGAGGCGDEGGIGTHRPLGWTHHGFAGR
jgi:hypothetical protein